MHCPSKIPHRYCVTEAVFITDHWEERSNGHIVVKFRFEKTDLDNKSWYAAEDSPEVYEPTDINILGSQLGQTRSFSAPYRSVKQSPTSRLVWHSMRKSTTSLST